MTTILWVAAMLLTIDAGLIAALLLCRLNAPLTTAFIATAGSQRTGPGAAVGLLAVFIDK